METDILDDKLWTREEAARLLRTTKATLATWECRGREPRPAITKIGRTPYYRESSLWEYLRRATNGSE